MQHPILNVFLTLLCWVYVSFHGFSQSCSEASNLSLGKSVQQSSVYGFGLPGIAVDGDRDGTRGPWGANPSIIHTQRELSPWWEVDLADTYNLDTLKIYNRTDCCGNRLRDFYVFVSVLPIPDVALDDLLGDNTIESYYFPGVAGDTVAIDLAEVSGNFVRIQLTREDILNLAEVEVWGCEETPPPPPPCDRPNWLFADVSNPDRALLSWRGPTEALLYDVRYRLFGTEEWTVLTNLSTTQVEIPVSRETDYQWEVRSKCGTGNSEYRGSSFLSGCIDAEAYAANLQVSEITESSATIDWSGPDPFFGPVVEYYYRRVGASEWTFGQVMDFVNRVEQRAILENLDAGTEYEWMGEVNCETTLQRSFIKGPNFSTLPGEPIGPTAELRFVPSLDCENDQFRAKIQIRSATEDLLRLGTSSVFFTFNNTALQFADYQSLNFDGSDLCIANVAEAWDEHNYDASSEPGKVNITILLNSEGFGCPDIGSGEWVDFAEITFDILDETQDPALQYNRDFTNFNIDQPNDGSVELGKGDFAGLAEFDLGCTLNEAPIASFTATPSNGEPPLIVSLDASSSSDPNGTIVSYEWDYGDGTGITETLPTTTKAYTSEGTYTVSLIVTDDGGLKDTATTDIMVNNANIPPLASFTAAPTVGTVPLAVDFNASASTDPDGVIVSYAWYFGDGNTGTGVTPGHTYTVAGTYTAQLIVTDDSAASDTFSTEIQVDPPINVNPVADLRLVDSLDCETNTYYTTIQIRSANASGIRLGTTSLLLDYSDAALQYASYESLSFDGSDLCIVGVANAWDPHSYDGSSVPGTFNLTIALNSEGFGCPTITQDEWTSIGILEFSILDNSEDPGMKFDRTNTNFNVDAPNDGSLTVGKGDFVGLSGDLLSCSTPGDCDTPQNLALGKDASQSSTYGVGAASYAVDGNTSGASPWSADLQHTQEELQPWWQVDLNTFADLDSIKIFNRSNCCGNRLRNFYVFVSETPFAGGSTLESLLADGDIWNTSFPGVAGDSLVIPLTGNQGQYVRIQLAGEGILHLAEIQVWGCESTPPPVPCPEPSKLSADVSTPFKALLAWEGVPEAISYELRYKTYEEETWTILTNLSATQQEIDVLTDTGYDWEVRSQCEGGFSEWVGDVFISICQNADELASQMSVSQITATSAFLDWYIDEGLYSGPFVGYRYRIVGESQWIERAFDDIIESPQQILLENLQPNTPYEWEGEVFCFSRVYLKGPNFTTLPELAPCPTPTGLLAYVGTNERVILTWEGPFSEYDVRYREEGSPNWLLTTAIEEPQFIAFTDRERRYEWEVRQVCEGNTSEWVSSSFTTVCFDAETLSSQMSVNQVTSTSAFLDWSVGGLSLSPIINYRYRILGDSDWIEGFVEDPSRAPQVVLIENLNPNTSYEWEGEVLCTSSGFRTYLQGPTFTTLPQVNSSPVADFSTNPSSGTAPLSVSFDASSSNDPDGTIVSYNWDFGDGNTGTGVNTSHTYQTSGDFAATLIVTDDSLSTDTFQVVITVEPTISDDPCDTPQNLALGKVASQSSTYGAGAALYAVDGNLIGSSPWSADLQHTQSELSPWWEVDLGESANLDSVRIYNRSNCCQNRLKQFYIFISDAPFGTRALAELLADSSISQTYVEEPVGESISIGTVATGKYVRIQLTSNGILHMAEVEVMGCPGNNNSAQRFSKVTDELAGENPSTLIQAFPNPFSQEIQVDLGENWNSVKAINVYNAMGQRIYEKALGTTRTLDLGANWPAGIYWVEVFSGGTIQTLQVVKQ